MRNNAAFASHVNRQFNQSFTPPGNIILNPTVLAREAGFVLENALSGHRLRSAHSDSLSAVPRPSAGMLSESVSVHYCEKDRLLSINRFSADYFALPLRQMADGIADSSRGRRVVFWDIPLPSHCEFAERIVNPQTGISLLVAGIYDVREDRMLLTMATQFSLVN